MAADSAKSLAQDPPAESLGVPFPPVCLQELSACYIGTAGQHTVVVPHRCQAHPYCIDRADAHSCSTKRSLGAATHCCCSDGHDCHLTLLSVWPLFNASTQRCCLAALGSLPCRLQAPPVHTDKADAQSCPSGLPLITSSMPAGARPRQRTYQELVQQYKDRLGSIGGPVSTEELQAFMGCRRPAPAGVEQGASAQERQPMRLRRWSTGGPPPR